MKESVPSAGLSVVIPTFMREQVLVDTIRCLQRQSIHPDEILVVDQTPCHEEAVHDLLSDWHRRGTITWIRLETPSIPAAMNIGLEAASQPFVLYVDDDIKSDDKLVERHLEAYKQFPESSAVVGQVLQPSEASILAIIDGPRSGLRADLAFPFNSNRGDWVQNVMAGNLSVRREAALAIGGFDENFSGVAYRFETDFARRLIRAGGKIRFYPEASIHHLRAPSGGTRSEGNHMTSASPRYGLGDYYFAFKHGQGIERWRYSLARVFREVRTKFHLRHPWWIPVKLVGEMRALMAGRSLALQQQEEGS